MLNKMNKKLALLMAAMTLGSVMAAPLAFAGSPQFCQAQCRGVTGSAYDQCYTACIQHATN
jgi:hypothetical protein